MGAVAAVVGTLDFGFIHILPRVLPSKNVVYVLALQRATLVVAFVKDILVGTRATFESVFAGEVDVGVVAAGGDATDGEDVGASRTD